MLLAALFGITASALTVAAWAQTNYYQSKTLTIMRGGTPGGYGDLQARALIPFLKAHRVIEWVDLDDFTAPATWK